jgi:hypothetical protein
MRGNRKRRQATRISQFRLHQVHFAPEARGPAVMKCKIADSQPVLYGHEADSPLLKDQLKKLQIRSDKTSAAVAELIRRTIDKYLKERAKELK